MIRVRSDLRVLGALVAIVLSGTPEPLRAQEPTVGRWTRRVPVTGTPPTIDGRIRPAEWKGAAVIEDLMQIEPREGVAPSEKTFVYLMVDRDNLYIALDCRDSEPAEILASQITRDAVLDPDDRVELVFDTFHDLRNAYFFQIGPGGSKGDGLIAGNGTYFNKDWDGIWEGEAVIHEGGWSAELALPAKTLSFEPGRDSWGFNVKRHIKRRTEEAQWAHPTRRNRLFQIATSGTLTGLAVLDPGLGLDVVPFLATRNRRDHASSEDSTEVEPGLDLRYRVTPSLTSALTVNTDFAETEVDNRVVNLTRFPVLLPEKRDFFLEDTGIFSFGQLEGDLLPFFSRRIGLSREGEPVPIVAGVKLTGRIGRLDLGVLDVQTDDFGGEPGKNLAVGRASLRVLSGSQAGVLFTLGDPATEGDNALAGVDFSWRPPPWRGNRVFRLDAFALATRDDPEAGAPEAPPSAEDDPVNGHAFGMSMAYPNDTVDAELTLQEISANFRPDLGFLRRSGVRHARGRLRWQPRPQTGPVRRYTFGAAPTVYWSLSDREVESAELRITLAEALFHSGDGVEALYVPTEERLLEPFAISEGVVIPPGRYRFDRWALELETADTRRVFGTIGLDTGTFFSGRRDTYTAAVTFRPVRMLTFQASLEHNDVRLAEGDFTANLARLHTTVDFNPRVSWITLAQWDDRLDSLGINSRLRWILSPGREAFLVWTRAFDTRDPLRPDRGSSLTPATTETALKLAYTLRF